MELAMVGLGKMGANMTRRLMRGGHEVVVFDLNPEAVKTLAGEGARGIENLESLKKSLAAPRTVWVMVPAGKPTEATVFALADILEPGDTIIDGGNSNFHETLRRAEAMKAKGLSFVDAGVSGGVWGLENGYSMMVGGETGVVNRIRPVFETLAPGPEKGWGHVGGHGAGHYSKMVHNGIEYGLMQAYAEGFEILNSSRFDLDLEQLCGIWNHGSVIRSWLLELAQNVFEEDQTLAGIGDFVPDSGEGRWTLQESVDLDVPAPVLYAALMTRFRSRQEVSYQSQVLSALRNQFGGHAIKKASS